VSRSSPRTGCRASNRQRRESGVSTRAAAVEAAERWQIDALTQWFKTRALDDGEASDLPEELLKTGQRAVVVAAARGQI